ncbi:MAG: hypothetical protein JWP58_244 [Hymenobacter sp.]|nr:hypothetical protein [Hymenobacter sp.]
MKTHVTPETAAAVLAARVCGLRADLLAALINNPLFTPEEQLVGNHSAYECESPERLARWLRNVQHEAARRERIHAAQAHDLARLLKHPQLDKQCVEVLPLLFGRAATEAKRAQVLGQVWLMVLERVGRIGHAGEILN